ncbi:response regulator [Tianweitania sediminis]|uniref:Response regulator n=1 Tax=Tianweitania sediminis TaxID=1502156 RepID=A0A8J7R507_9HYPH|nr:response regulator [Tianweitania sediminis]MBP0441358.1 response regulator [Tianweitania sediminis]
MPILLYVLIVEDEGLLRIDIADELTDRGFQVLEASNATQALEVLCAHPEIEVLFTDVDMPGGIDGLKLAEEVRERWPPIRIIVTSGYRVVQSSDLPADSRFLRKPYTAKSVAEAIRQMAA